MQAYISKVDVSYSDWAEKNCIFVYFAGCDFMCPYCFSSPILDFKDEYLKDLREIKDIIKSFSHSTDSIYITGGEPCLQKPALLDILKFSRQLGLETGIQTNGSNPKVISSIVNSKLVDYISLDLKAPFDEDTFEKTTRSKTFFKQTRDIMESLKETIHLLKLFGSENISIDVRTTIIPSLMFKKEHILRIASEVKSINCRWIFQQYTASAGRVLSSSLGGVNPPTSGFLENLREACLKIYPTLNIIIKTSDFNSY